MNKPYERRSHPFRPDYVCKTIEHSLEGASNAQRQLYPISILLIQPQHRGTIAPRPHSWCNNTPVNSGDPACRSRSSSAICNNARIAYAGLSTARHALRVSTFYWRCTGE